MISRFVTGGVDQLQHCLFYLVKTLTDISQQNSQSVVLLSSLFRSKNYSFNPDDILININLNLLTFDEQFHCCHKLA